MKAHSSKHFGIFVAFSIRRVRALGILCSLICFAVPSWALADPVLDFQFLNSGQILGPTDVVQVYGKKTF